MQIKLSGSIHYANGVPIPDVIVRIYDKDAASKEDDDLTITPGLSNEQGRFELVYEPLRYMDYYTIHLPGMHEQPGDTSLKRYSMHIPDILDVYLPYLRFDFVLNGINRQHTTALGLFSSEFFLPVNPPTNFQPSKNGFKFANSFAGYFLPYSTPAFLSSRKVSSKYGLCGGMCAAVYDFLLAGKPVPPNTDVPRQGSRFQRYLFQRQMDSLGGLGQQAIKVAQWTSLPDDTLVGTQRRTVDEFIGIRSKLDDGNLVILALIYEHAASLKQLSRLVFSNHQVLAYAYQAEDDDGYSLQVYDPNLPSRDDVLIRSERVELGVNSSPQGEEKVYGFRSAQLVGGEFYKSVRGFFEIPYSPFRPPDKI